MNLFKKKDKKTELEVSEKHVGLRIKLAVGFLVLGLCALGFFFDPDAQRRSGLADD